MSSPKGSWVQLTLTLLVFISAYAAIRLWVFNADANDLIVELLFTILIFGVGILRAFFPKVRSAIDYCFSQYWKFFSIYAAAILPMSLFYMVAKKVVEEANFVFQLIYLIIAAGIWFSCLLALAKKHWRKSLFTFLLKLGWLSPAIFLFNYLMVSVILFATSSYLVNDYWKLSQGANLSTFLDLYSWHLLDGIPGLDINKTLRWDEPILRETPSLLGFILLFFKITVILPGIGIFVVYWKQRNNKNK